MKYIAENRALEKLQCHKTEFARVVRENYESEAKSCSTCSTPGACCLDAHFVNVRISRLESAAILKSLSTLPPEQRENVDARIDAAISKYRLREDPENTYTCPLYETGTGCLVHHYGKPLPCIAHACYENQADLPPDELLNEYERRAADLNRRTYGRVSVPEALPLAIRKRADQTAGSSREA